MNLLIICGATRPKSKTKTLCNYISAQIVLNFPQINQKLISPNDFEIKFDDDRDPKYNEIANWAEIFLIISPEYNRGYPGKLKTLLDSAYVEYKNKPVLIGGVSNGDFGGARMVQHLALILREFGMILQSKDLLFPNIDKVFDERGTILDQSLLDKQMKVLEQFLNFSLQSQNARYQNV